MNIGQLARQTGLTSSRIRFYERAGLLKTVQRKPNGYRTYPPEAVLVLELITTAQRAGFSLDEIRALLPPGLERWDHGALLEALRRKLVDIEAMEARLKQSRKELAALIAEIEAKPHDMDCAANARRVLSRVLHREIESTGALVGDTGALAKTGRRRVARAN